MSLFRSYGSLPVALKLFSTSHCVAERSIDLDDGFWDYSGTVSCFATCVQSFSLLSLTCFEAAQ